MPSNLEVAQRARLKPIAEIAAALGVEDDELELYGRYKAKVALSILQRLAPRPDGKYIDVTSITPTPLGEGKTTTTVGLAMALNRIGCRAIATIRQPSLGPAFGIKGASEGMPLLGPTTSLRDLRARLGRIVVALDRRGQAVTAEQLRAAGAMAVLMRDAIKPTLLQTVENTPAFVHAGPFGNIATGNSSILADLIGLKLGDCVVTESGFGADMGLEKFVDIKCRTSGRA